MIVLPTPSAFAAPSCVTGYLCAYEDKTFNGARGMFGGPNPDWSVFSKSTGGTWDNVASSAYDNGTDSTRLACMFAGYNYSPSTPGDWVCFRIGGSSDDLSFYGMNNRTSSNNWPTHTP
jgi:hypothetical protein